MANFIQPLNDGIQVQTVRYQNRFGIDLVANLYRAADFDASQAHPAIVVGPPFGGVKEQGPHVYAQRLAAAGFVALAFDPAFNGASGGARRHLADPSMLAEDFSAAVDYLSNQPFVNPNRIGALGICGSGGFSLAAAQVDVRIKAVATASMIDIAGSTPTFFPDKAALFAHLREVAAQRTADFVTGDPELGPRGLALQVADESDPVRSEFAEFYSTPRGYHPRSIGQFTLNSDQALLMFSHQLDHLDWLEGRPTLVLAGEKFFSRPLQEAIAKRLPEPTELVVVPSANHIDLYDNVKLIPWEKLLNFFQQAL